MNIDLVNDAYEDAIDAIDAAIEHLGRVDRLAVLAKIQIEIGGRLEDEDDFDDEEI